MILLFLIPNDIMRFFLKSNLKNIFSRDTGAFLIATAFLMGLIMLGLVIGLATLGIFNSQATADARYAQSAWLAAQSGIADGILKIIYDKNCPDANCNTSYSFAVGEATTTVQFCKDTCLGVGKTTVTSTGVASRRIFSLQAIVTVDTITGKVQLNSKKEL